MMAEEESMGESIALSVAKGLLNGVLRKINITAKLECFHERITSSYGCRCTANDIQVTACADSRVEAKVAVMYYMLRTLAKKGYPVPIPYGFEDQPPSAASKCTVYTPLVREICAKNKLELNYELVDDENARIPSPLPDDYPVVKMFTIKVTVNQIERRATASTRKAAQEMASRFMYDYLRITFPEEGASANFFLNADDSDDDDFDFGLACKITPQQNSDALQILEQAPRAHPNSPERVLNTISSVLQLELDFYQCDRDDADTPLELIELRNIPDAVFDGNTRADAAKETLEYIKFALKKPSHYEYSVPRG